MSNIVFLFLHPLVLISLQSSFLFSTEIWFQKLSLSLQFFSTLHLLSTIAFTLTPFSILENSKTFPVKIVFHLQADFMQYLLYLLTDTYSMLPAFTFLSEFDFHACCFDIKTLSWHCSILLLPQKVPKQTYPSPTAILCNHRY